MKIHLIQTGAIRVKRSFLTGSVALGGIPQFLWKMRMDREWAEPLPIYAWLIEHSEGLMLIDSGDTAAAPPSPLIPAEPHIHPEDELPAQLRRLGVDPRDIRMVVMTHLHGDHVNGLAGLSKQRVLVGATELREAQSLGGRMLARLTIHPPAWFSPMPITFVPERIGAFEHSYPLTQAGDVRAVPTPGHTRGHLSVIVQDGDIDLFLAGDVTYSQKALLAQQQQGPCTDVAGHRDTLARVLRHIHERPTVYLPSHDIDAPARLAQRATVAKAVAA
jgi:glyoxylase-like metal-dependent hydrolase (beta-lactamase superfamily II)